MLCASRQGGSDRRASRPEAGGSMVPRSFFDLGPEMANERLHALAHGVVPLDHLREDLLDLAALAHPETCR